MAARTASLERKQQLVWSSRLQLRRSRHAVCQSRERGRGRDDMELVRRNSRRRGVASWLPAPAQVNAAGNELLPDSPLHDGRDEKGIETG
jgi:hypothetical protein